MKKKVMTRTITSDSTDNVRSFISVKNVSVEEPKKAFCESQFYFRMKKSVPKAM